MTFETALLVSAVALSAHGPVPPELPMKWMHGGSQVLAFPLPPWKHGVNPVPSLETPMRAGYDWSQHRMREIYSDACVPIFPNGSQWSCDFLNVDGVSYLIQHEDRPVGQPECCVFEKPWVPPNPKFASTLPFLKTTIEPRANGDSVNWYQTTNVPVSAGGPFGYGFRNTSGSGKMIPFAFYFGGFWNFANNTFASANVLQYFDDFTAVAPPDNMWDIPEACSTAVKCNNFP